MRTFCRQCIKYRYFSTNDREEIQRRCCGEKSFFASILKFFASLKLRIYECMNIDIVIESSPIHFHDIAYKGQIAKNVATLHQSSMIFYQFYLYSLCSMTEVSLICACIFEFEIKGVCHCASGYIEMH